MIRYNHEHIFSMQCIKRHPQSLVKHLIIFYRQRMKCHDTFPTQVLDTVRPYIGDEEEIPRFVQQQAEHLITLSCYLQRLRKYIANLPGLDSGIEVNLILRDSL